MSSQSPVIPDPWQELRSQTRARIALGRSGSSLPTREVLNFAYAHAMARDAVHMALDSQTLNNALQNCGFESISVRSQAPDRATYLLRPDMGRKLSADSLRRLHDSVAKSHDVLFVVSDGLSALAVSSHAVSVLTAIRKLLPSDLTLGPVIVAEQARVALSDMIGEAMQARVVVMLVGERPGLTSPDSLGIYMTFQPKAGRQDSERNCISNIRPQGLDYESAARKAAWLIDTALKRKVSGLALKDESDVTSLVSQSIRGLTSD
jgi:ethanolamine ammonia-lyase small subunit